MVLKSFDDLAESVISECLDVVIPSGKVKPGHSRLAILIEDVHEVEIEAVCLLQIRKHLEQYLSPCLLLVVPSGLVHEQDVPAACHNLWLGLTVGHPFGLPITDEVLLSPCVYGLALCTMLFDGLVLLSEHFPSEGYPHLVDCLGHQLLHVEAVVDQLRLGEYSPHRQHHGRGQVRGHGFHPATYHTWNHLQDIGHHVRGHAAHHGRQCPLASVSRLVRQDGVHLTIGQAGLVKAHVLSEVVGKQHVLLGMLQLLPVSVVADFLLVLFAKRLTLQTITGCKRGDTHGRGLNLPLLKNPQTRRSDAFRQIRTNPSRS